MASTTSTFDKPSSRLYDIPKLLNDGSNFTLWKFRISQILEARGLTDYVNGQKQKPDGSDAKALEEWIVKDRDARLQVTLTLEDEPASGIMDLTESKPIWDALSTRYDGKGLQSAAYLMTKVFRGQMLDTQDLHSQINEIRTYASKLATLGQPLSDKMFTVAIVISLPSSYSTLQTVLSATPDAQLDSHTAISMILAEEQRKHESSEKVLKARVGKSIKSNKSKED